MDFDEIFKQDLVLLGRHIRKLREERGLTLAEVSSATGISISYLKKIEEGKAYRIKVFAHIFPMIELFHISFKEIFSFKNNSNL